MGSGDTLLNAVIGAAVTVVLSFSGVSPLVGGGVAGYLQAGSRADGARVGAIAGGFAAVPLLLAVGVALVWGAVLAGLPAGVELGVLALVGVAVLSAVVVGLSAVGGYAGAYLQETY